MSFKPSKSSFGVSKMLGQITPGVTTALSIYSPPVNTETIIKFITITNDTGQDKDAEIFMDDDGTTYDKTTRIGIKTITKNSENPPTEIFVAMNNSSGNLAVKSSTADALTFTIWGTETDVS